MPITLEALGIARLSVRERLELIDQIWDSLPDSIEPEEVPDWHLVELARRRAEAQARPGEGRPWREVLESLRARP
ncbi:MAG: addiction module protein [Gemmataceae bacterium]|nr:addiction module protein [Gemmataceae bacterium]MCI0738865.1 addiction module protein [Gemmataceae bacterium]